MGVGGCSGFSGALLVRDRVLDGPLGTSAYIVGLQLGTLTPLQVQSGPRIQWSQMQWEMVAGVGRLLWGLWSIGGCRWSMECAPED